MDLQMTLAPYGSRWKLHRRLFNQSFKADMIDRYEPLQLVAADSDARALTGGTWRWAGTRLIYDHYGRTNRGTYYACATEGGGSGVFMNMQP